MADNGFKIKGVKFDDDHALIIVKDGRQVKVARSDHGLWDVHTETADGFRLTFCQMSQKDAVQNAKELLEGDEL